MRNSVAAHAGVDLLNNIIWDGKGIDCKFYALSEHVGLKTYRDSEDAIFTYTTQRRLHRVGIAPYCWGLSTKNGVYCYFTEMAEVMAHRLFRQGKMRGKKYADDEVGHDKFTNRFYSIIKNLVESKTDFCVNDMHVENIGMLNGRLVIIDCGHFEKKSERD